MDSRPVPAWHRVVLAPAWCVLAVAVGLLLARNELLGGPRRRRAVGMTVTGGVFWYCWAEMG